MIRNSVTHLKQSELPMLVVHGIGLDLELDGDLDFPHGSTNSWRISCAGIQCRRTRLWT